MTSLIKTFVDKQGIKHGDSRVPSKMSTKSSPAYELINRNENFRFRKELKEC